MHNFMITKLRCFSVENYLMYVLCWFRCRRNDLFLSIMSDCLAFSLVILSIYLDCNDINSTRGDIFGLKLCSVNILFLCFLMTLFNAVLLKFLNKVKGPNLTNFYYRKILVIIVLKTLHCFKGKYENIRHWRICRWKISEVGIRRHLVESTYPLQVFQYFSSS